MVGYMRADLVVEGSQTYRPDALKILGLRAEDEFPVARSSAGFAYAAWLPDGEFLGRVYEDAIDHSRSVTGEPWYRGFLLDLAARLLRAAGASNKPLKALDYGCGYGGLLGMLACRDIECVGYEPSKVRRIATGSATCILSDAGDVTTHAPFDLVVCTEVLEHLADPQAALRMIRASAATDAVVLVTVPCCTTSYLNAALAGFAAGHPQPPMFNPWEHLNYFAPTELRQLLASEGFEVVADLGRVTSARMALDGNVSPATLARVVKRLVTSAPSTQLLCKTR